MKKKLSTGLFYLTAFIFLLFASCKKEIISSPEKIGSKMKTNDGVKVENIPYSQFLNLVDIAKTGTLKQSLLSKSTKNSTSSSGGLELDMGNVKKLIAKGKTSYVISLKPETPHAIAFRNITIQETNGQTTAFMTTYIPTRKWINEWKKGVQTDSVFRGETYSQKINLTELPKLSNSAGTLGVGSPSTIMINGNKISLAPGECEYYDVYITVNFPCAEGHISRDDCNYLLAHPGSNWEEVDGDWPPYSVVMWAGTSTYCEPGGGGTGSGGSGGGSGGGGGGTTPNPPDPYDPCDTETPPPPSQATIKKGGTGIFNIPPPPCDGEPPFDENAEIILPENWDMEFEEGWLGTEDEYAVSGALIAQTISGRADPIPEMYYLNGVGIDMSPATPRNGRTVFNAPRNHHQYFWKELVRIKPQMFDAANRSLIKSGVAPIINDQWLKYNPTHVSFKGQKLIHHHESQGNIAYAIPQKVHTKWSAILHQWRTTGKIPRAGGKTLNKMSIGVNVAHLFTGWFTGNPDAWINWYGGNQNQIGKVYYHQEKDCYWVITYKNDTIVNGRLTKATVTYDIYEGYIWDYDENKYMGVIKLGTFTEHCDLINGTSEGTDYISG